MSKKPWWLVPSVPVLFGKNPHKPPAPVAPPPPPSNLPTTSLPYLVDDWSNTPVDPNNPNILQRSAAIVNWMVNAGATSAPPGYGALGYHFGIGAQGMPTYIATASTPRVTVQQNLSGTATGNNADPAFSGGYWSNVPIASNWRPGSGGLFGSEAGGEPDMCIFDSTNGDEWFFYKATIAGDAPIDYGTANSFFQARGVGVIRGSKGIGSKGTAGVPGPGGSATDGFPAGWKGYSAGGSAGSTTYQDAGMNAGSAKIKAWEAAGPVGADFGHALCCSVPRACYGWVYPSDFITKSVTWDESELTAVPSGARYWLPYTFDVENAICDWPNSTWGTNGNWYGKPLNEIDKKLARTFQKYGCYIKDQNGSPAIAAAGGNDNSIGIDCEGEWAPTMVRGEAAPQWHNSVMAPFTPRLTRAMVAALKVTSFFPQSRY